MEVSDSKGKSENKNTQRIDTKQMTILCVLAAGDECIVSKI